MMEARAIDLTPLPGATDPAPTESSSEQTPTSNVNAYVSTRTVGDGGPQSPWTAGEQTPSPAHADPAVIRARGPNDTFVARFDEHPLGLWAAAGLHHRAFGRRS